MPSNSAQAQPPTAARLLILSILLAGLAAAQTKQPSPYGAPPFRPFISGHGVVMSSDRGTGPRRAPEGFYAPTLNFTRTIPIWYKPGRGVPSAVNPIYNSTIYRNNGTAFEPIGQETPSGLQHVWWGWLPMTQNGYATYDVMMWTCTYQVCTQYGCSPTQESYPEYYNFRFYDPSGTTHYFGITTYGSNSCNAGTPNGSGGDGNGWTMAVSSYNQAVVTGPNGWTYSGDFGSGTVEDTNGNEVNGTDTTGATVPSGTTSSNCVNPVDQLTCPPRFAQRRV